MAGPVACERLAEEFAQGVDTFGTGYFSDEPEIGGYELRKKGYAAVGKLWGRIRAIFQPKG